MPFPAAANVQIAEKDRLEQLHSLDIGVLLPGCADQDEFRIGSEQSS
jgi:hypothetical protein